MRKLYVSYAGRPWLQSTDRISALVTDEFWDWNRRWYNTRPGQDGPLSGVWADWIEEHPEHILSDPDGAIPRLVVFLRERFTRGTLSWAEQTGP